MPRPRRDEANRSCTWIASYIPSGCYGIDSKGALPKSENRGQDGLGADALSLLKYQTTRTRRRERRAPEPRFQAGMETNVQSVAALRGS
jgi:hypothetical protein